jgi:serine/threonine protein kinase
LDAISTIVGEIFVRSMNLRLPNDFEPIWDNVGKLTCRLADFGASKKVVKFATIPEAKSMKGTPYWMAPEAIRRTVHNWQADMWSVGCTVIELATGKPPWSHQFQEVAALFHIGTTNHTLSSLSIFLIKARIFSSSVSRGSPH